jgi:hypothetical protein
MEHRKAEGTSKDQAETMLSICAKLTMDLTNKVDNFEHFCLTDPDKEFN